MIQTLQPFFSQTTDVSNEENPWAEIKGVLDDEYSLTNEVLLVKGRNLKSSFLFQSTLISLFDCYSNATVSTLYVAGTVSMLHCLCYPKPPLSS